MTSDQFSEAMDNDKAFQSKRKALIFCSLLLLVLVISGAQIKEANTFIFKIEFTSHERLSYMLAAAVAVCMLRYYSYSEKYHNQLFKFWSARLLRDHEVYFLDYETGESMGLLGKRINVDPSVYDLENPRYRRAGFLKRSIGLRTTEDHGVYEGATVTQFFSLNVFNDYWSKKDLYALLRREFKYRFLAWFKHRETLDLVSPHLVALASLLYFGYSLCSG
ncbi:TPA: hypothetical protein QEM96_000590 [Pseudomonas putida]|nr:hypothetical protein [Pseudomonas putida]